MSDNEDAKRKAAAQLEQGEVFAFGLSEQAHGADVYQTDMILTPSEHGWTASGEKYYIGNANVARMVSTFGKIEDSSKEPKYVFFAADSQHDRYELKKNVVNSQNYVANYALHDYPVTEADLLHRGMGPSMPRLTRSTSASTTWAGARSACAPTPSTRPSRTRPTATCTAPSSPTSATCVGC
ncbi:acyl-CoA dehydrogenase, middle domain protein [Mycobacterium ulcerans str. Harvey]|uniref:Acyl-CoA dehydrogenase, middle domain protein n=1 Tax=Mycobacterium ulcerans str. Harvey TaxID=1299332 RepID=A0ABN0QKL2_MYCUL|nr:acyl-CoA dehydrogenase, middle domain protein [Mycobacterium ulcerans str. Harvey]